MEVEILITSAVSLSAAGLAIWGQIRNTRMSSELQALTLAEQRRLEVDKTTTRYREPLARAAYDLQSRLYNILEQDLIGAYLNSGDEREQSYVVDNTTFLIAQFLAWTEIIRRDVQYIDLGRDSDTRKLERLRDDIYAIFQSDRWVRTLRLFAGEQRAIGELMIRDSTRGPECLGYGAFLSELAKAHDPLIEYIRRDVRSLSTRLSGCRPRLVALQHALIDLLAFLDPKFIRFPRKRRSKAPKSAPSRIDHRVLTRSTAP